MTAAPGVTGDAIRPASPETVPTVAAMLRPIHCRLMTEATSELAPTMAPDADFWSGWSAVRYLNDRFDRQYSGQRILVAALLPLLSPADALVLRTKTDSLEEVRYDLDRVGRWRHMTALTGGLAYRLLKLLKAWFSEIERVTQGVTDAELSAEGRRALTELERTSPKLQISGT